MTPEDLAWVQTRLKNCANVRHQLKICAECLCTKESDLLVRLGYGSMDELCAAYPVRRVSLLPKRVRNTVPPEAMLEGVLCYYGGFDFDAVRKMLGCTQDMASATVRCRVYAWRQEHPTLAAGMPPKRPKPKEGVKNMKMTIDEKGLPAYAYARSRYTNNIVRVVRGERALFGVVGQDCVDALNSAAGVTRAQAAAMYGGAMYGWNSPMADPKNYSDTGSYIGPEMENANGEE